MGEFDFEDETDFGQEQANDSAGIKALRKAFRDQKKQLNDATKALEQVTKVSRKQTIENVLKEKKVNPKVANLIGADVEATPEAIGEWLGNYADVFNIKAEEPAPNANGENGQQGTQPPVLDAAQQAALARAQGTEQQGVTPDALGATAAARAIAGAKGKSFDDMVGALTAAGLVGD